MRCLTALALVSLLALSAGCSEPKIDGSSEESFQASFDELKGELEPGEQERLERAVLAIGVADLRQQGEPQAGDEEAATRSLLARMDGMTADELLREGEALLTASARDQ